jgi:glycosyltransferase involved in cell wall biosynthesis
MTDSARPLVSVLMTAYNREAFLPAAIESVLSQWWSDFELVVVDDRSSDRTLEIAREYARRDERIRVHANERNLGDYANRNHAASFARGEFLKFHDSDDIMYPHCLAVMVAALQAEPRAGFGLSRSRAWPGGPVPMFLTPRQAYQREFLGFGMFMCGPAGALFRTEVFRELGGFQDFGAPSDTIFWMRACARYPVLLLPADLFYYREHPGQTLRAPNVAKQYAKVPAHMWRALADRDCPLDDRERAVARRNVAFNTAKSIWRAARTRDFGLAWQRLLASEITPAEWLRYLKPPRRSVLAGVSS